MKDLTFGKRGRKRRRMIEIAEVSGGPWRRDVRSHLMLMMLRGEIITLKYREVGWMIYVLEGDIGHSSG